MLDYRVDQGVAELTLNHPPVNALTPELLDELMARLREAGADPRVRSVILSSALPGRFCGGIDLARFRDDSHEQAWGLIDRLYRQLHDTTAGLPQPVIGAIAGAVRGGGMSVAITCDLLVAAEDASFGYPELDVGMLPAIHYNHLPRIVGRQRAFDLLFTGRVFDAQEALALGLISATAPASSLMDRARALAQVLAAKPPALVRLGKASFVRAADQGYRQGASHAVDLIASVRGMPDCREGLDAFIAKRPPRWPSAA